MQNPHAFCYIKISLFNLYIQVHASSPKNNLDVIRRILRCPMGCQASPRGLLMGVRGGDVGNVLAFTPGGPCHHQALALHNHQIKMHEYHNLQMK